LPRLKLKSVFRNGGAFFFVALKVYSGILQTLI